MKGSFSEVGEGTRGVGPWDRGATLVSSSLKMYHFYVLGEPLCSSELVYLHLLEGVGIFGRQFVPANHCNSHFTSHRLLLALNVEGCR